MATNTTNYNLVKPSENEYYDINVSNSNLDIIDTEIKKINDKFDSVSTDAQSTSFDNSDNGMEATNVQDAIEENKTTIEENKASIEENKKSIEANKTSILNNTNLANQALTKANEAFQRGDNVKTQLVDKLISEGLDVSTDNSFEELIGSIALGKKWASGSLSNLDGNNYTSSKPLTVNYNLSFTPSFIFLYSTEFREIYGSSRYNYGFCASNISDFGNYKMNVSSIVINGSESFTVKTNQTLIFKGLAWYAFE